MIYSPLEQFTIIKLYELSNINIVLLLIFIILLLFNSFNSNLLELHLAWWYRNIKDLISDHLFILFTIWILILLANLIGMVPYSFTLTSQFIFVLSISIVVFISINILGIKLHSYNLLFLFLPNGVPLILIPLISILEFSLYFTRIISLTLRLSANMIAGHILIKIIIYAFINLPFLSILILPIIFLEILIAFLQGYVYLTLTISYYKDISLPH